MTWLAQFCGVLLGSILKTMGPEAARIMVEGMRDVLSDHAEYSAGDSRAAAEFDRMRNKSNLPERRTTGANGTDDQGQRMGFRHKRQDD